MSSTLLPAAPRARLAALDLALAGGLLLLRLART
jgi:hypothetical protein